MTDDLMDQAIYNSYQVLTGWMTEEQIIEHCEIRLEDIDDPEDISAMPIFLIPPGEEADNEDLDSMILHFESMECYEECGELLKLKK
mgnify:CR=1 FL=1|tara:strand:- start:444 stop:704 length:261 start_codon:yes stop_codon:yes gene_type:complete